MEASTFWDRIRRLTKVWEANTEAFQNVDCVCVAVGKVDEDTPENLRISALQHYLFAQDFPEALLTLYRTKLQVFSNSKQCDLVKAFADDKPVDLEFALEVIACTPDDRKAKFENVVETLNGLTPADSKTKVGFLVKENKWQKGEFAQTIIDLATKSSQIEVVDIAFGFAEVFGVKDTKEVDFLKRSATFTASVLKKYFINEMERIVDEGDKVKQSKLADDTEGIITNPKKSFSKVSDEFCANVDVCYSPIIQSGGTYEAAKILSCRAETTSSHLSFDTIIVGLGSKYRQYCTNVIRTFMIDAPAQQQKAYGILEEAYQTLLDSIKPGAVLGDVYKATKATVEKKAKAESMPQVVEKFIPSIGYGVGLGIREMYWNVTEASTKKFSAGMVLCVHVGFDGLQMDHSDANRKKVSMLIADTVLVLASANDRGQHVEMLTKVAYKFGDVSYTYDDQEDKKEEVKDEQDEKEKAQKWKTTLRHQKGEVKSTAIKREEDQRRIFEMKQKEGANRDRTKAEQKKDMTLAGQLARGQINSYNAEREMPEKRGQGRVVCDMSRQTVLIPIDSYHVPFHLSTLKNVSSSREGEFSYLRFNFHLPSGGAAAYTPGILFPQCTFIKELTYKCRSQQYAEQILAEVNAGIKRMKQNENQQKEIHGLVSQGTLQIEKGSAVPRLKDVSMKPNPRGRKAGGTLEGHKNGVRFTYGGDNIDVLYGNVKHAIFQPADRETLVLVHFHLKNHIIVNNKKTLDVQFYTEVCEDEVLARTNNRHYSEEQEIAEEAKQREFIKQVNTEFLHWCKRLEEHIRFEMPFRKSEFSGTALRNTVTLRKTDNCIVSLAEGPPFFVLSLQDVELCVLERVILGQKNFDLVFVMKDYTKPVQRIDTVEMKRLDDIKDWLTTKLIKFYECRQPLQWPQILKEVINDDQAGVWEPWSADSHQGWASFLDMDRDDSDASDTSTEDSAFNPEDSSDEDDADDDSEESEATTDSDDVFSDDSDAESEESGMSWDELEEQAKKDDMEAEDVSDVSDDSDKPKKAKKKHTPAPVVNRGAPVARPGANGRVPPRPMARPGAPKPGARPGMQPVKKMRPN